MVQVHSCQGKPLFNCHNPHRRRQQEQVSEEMGDPSLTDSQWRSRARRSSGKSSAPRWYADRRITCQICAAALRQRRRLQVWTGSDATPLKSNAYTRGQSHGPHGTNTHSVTSASLLAQVETHVSHLEHSLRARRLLRDPLHRPPLLRLLHHRCQAIARLPRSAFLGSAGRNTVSS